jgi:ferrochelatase
MQPWPAKFRSLGYWTKQRILEEHDPYPKQLQASTEAVADILKLDHWTFAYQSAGRTGEKWLGPDIPQTLNDISQKSKPGGGHVLVVPIGFVADHLEILYEIEIEARKFAQSHGLDLKRIESLNTGPKFVTALADVVRKRVE